MSRTGWQTEAAAEGPSSSDWCFVARQPILSVSGSVFGYELLARSGWENFFSGEPGPSSAGVVDTMLAFGVNSLVGETAAFINCTGETLRSEWLELLPRSTVLELLESIVPDEQVVADCRRLRGLGFRLALDDFDFSPQWAEVLPLVEFVKVDVRTSTAEQRRKLLRELRGRGIRPLAEKVETEEEYRALLREGFELFQGYFFMRPMVMARPPLPSVMNQLKLMTMLRANELEVGEVLEVLRLESALSIRLLRAANSARLNRGTSIADLQTAYLHVGEQQFRSLAAFVVGQSFCGPNKCKELHRTILLQSRLCELMAPLFGLHAGEMFVVGMLSVVSGALRIDLEALTEARMLSVEALEALQGSGGSATGALVGAARALQAADWVTLGGLAAQSGVDVGAMMRQYWAAQMWADGLFRSYVEAA